MDPIIIHDITAVENAVGGIRWVYNVATTLRDVWISPQFRIIRANHKNRGSKPLIDFHFNGRLNLSIDVALNLEERRIREHLGRFGNSKKKTGKLLCVAF